MQHEKRVAESLGISPSKASKVIDALQDLCVRQGGRRPSRASLSRAITEAVSARTPIPEPIPRKEQKRRRLLAQVVRRVDLPWERGGRATAKRRENKRGGDASEKFVEKWKLNLDHRTGRRDGFDGGG